LIKKFCRHKWQNKSRTNSIIPVPLIVENETRQKYIARGLGTPFREESEENAFVEIHRAGVQWTGTGINDTVGPALSALDGLARTFHGPQVALKECR